MKEGWEVKKLGEVCEVLNGFAFKSDKYIDNGVRVIRITNVQHGYIEDNDPKFYPINECEKLNQYMLREQDLLMSLTGNVGRVGLLDSKYLSAALNQRVACLRVKDNSVELKYLFHLLNSELFEARCIQSAKGIAQKNMSTEWLKEYSIPIPPLPEQSRIVEELDLLSNIIEKKRQQLSELDNLAQSIFYDMFGDPVTNEKGWEVKKLGEVCKSDLGKTLNQSKDKGEYHNYLCAINVLWGYINLNNLKQARFEEFELEKYSVQKGDLLVCEGGDVGRAAIWDKDEPMVYQNALHRVRFDKSILAIYALYWLQWLKNHSELDKYVKGVTIKHLVKSSLLSIPICIPPLSLQQLFTKKIEAIEKQKALIKQSIAETEELFNSRMDYYFS